MRTKIGTVTSAKMQKTVTVTVHRYVMHQTYGKRFRKSKKFLADTNGMEPNVGDTVVITECRPLSKNKCFKITEITKKAEQLTAMHTEDIEATHGKRDHRDRDYVKPEKKVSSPSA